MNSVVVSLSSAAIVNATVVLSSSDGAVATVPSSVLVPAGQAIGRFDITIGAVAGSAIITATYNGGSAQCSVVASNPSTGVQWPNEPSGMIVVTDTPFSDSLPAEWFNVYNTQSYASPSGVERRSVLREHLMSSWQRAAILATGNGDRVSVEQ